MSEARKKKKGYANKVTDKGVFLGCERNHERHPAVGIPWCELCLKAGRGRHSR